MKIKHVYGNVLRIDIPLTIKIRTIEEGEPSEREEPFYPDASKGCIVEIANNYNRKIEYEATIKDNIVHIEDIGKISIGQYKVTVKCYDSDGNPYRYMVRDVVEICDATADAGIEAGVEFNAETYTLEGAVFVSYGEEQVQSDWNEHDSESNAYIKNKPDLAQYAKQSELIEVEEKIPVLPQHIVTDENYVHTDNNYTSNEKAKLRDVADGAQVNVIEQIKINGSAATISDKSVNIHVPTDNISLANGAGYQTENQVNELIDSKLQSYIVPKGNMLFENLPTPASTNMGWMWNMQASFTIDNRFVEYEQGVTKTYPKGANVYVIDNGTDQEHVYMFDIYEGFIDTSHFATDDDVEALSQDEIENICTIF